MKGAYFVTFKLFFTPPTHLGKNHMNVYEFYVQWNHHLPKTFPRTFQGPKYDKYNLGKLFLRRRKKCSALNFSYLWTNKRKRL